MISASSPSSATHAPRDALSGADTLGICSLSEMREVEGEGVIYSRSASKSISSKHVKTDSNW